uniref:Uncharacterized protein n=1 Tax=Strongyloides venezuelensis TaxID=75913 RepID=A0A0K0FJH4_STRVS
MESLQRSIYRHIGDLSYRKKAKKLVSEGPPTNSPSFIISSNSGLNYQMNPCYLLDPNQTLADKITYNYNNISINNQKFETNKEEEDGCNRNDNDNQISSNSNKINLSSSKRLTSLISKPAVQSRKVSNSITKIFGFKKHEKMVNEIYDINSFSNIAEDQNINVTSVTDISDKNNNDKFILQPLSQEDEHQEKEKVLTKFQKLKKGLNVVDPRKVKPNAKKNEYRKCLILDEEE